MQDQTVGIVGFGNIGRLLYKKLSAFSCKEFYIYDPYLPKDLELDKNVQPATLDVLLQKSTVISLHLPLNDETHHLISANRLALMQPGTILINASRGGIVDETALLAHLERHDLVYAADVVEDEPHVNTKLLAHPNVIITPHIASLTTTADKQMVEFALRNFLGGNQALL